MNHPGRNTPAHLYVHWPFCSKKCHFCDFVAFEQHGQFQDQYHKALCNEIIGFAATLPVHAPGTIRTFFMGGGTPSLYPLELFTELFACLRNNYDLSNMVEASMEVNPADVDEEKLDTWQAQGINRLSIGVQSLDDAVLERLNRRQRATDVRNVMQRAPKYIQNISVDLILGLPGIGRKAWFDTLAQIVQWPIKHISIYFLTIHENTPLFFKVAKGTVQLADDHELVQTYLQSIEYLEQNGFMQYELSNFAKPGYESIHNMAYWQRVPYQGFGIGASSFDGLARSTTTKNLPTYLESLAGGPGLPPTTTEILTSNQAALEVLMLGLRRSVGVHLHDVVYYLDASGKVAFLSKVQQLLAQGLLVHQEDRISLPRHLLPLENEIVAKLL